MICNECGAIGTNDFDYDNNGNLFCVCCNSDNIGEEDEQV